MSAALDPYATAKANLRDNVKTLQTVFGGVAGLVLAGSPFSSLGTLKNGRLVLALAALIASTYFAGKALRVLLKVLQPTLVYSKWLREDFRIDSIRDAATRAEITFLRGEFDKNRGALLPDVPGTQDGITSIETLEAAIDKYWNVWKNPIAADASAEDQSTFERARAIWQTYYDALADIQHWGGFVWFHRQVTGGTAVVLRFGLCATVSILAFAWAANPPKAEASRGDTIVIKETAKWPLPPKEKFFEPLYFDPGRFELSKAAMEQINHARDFLREHTDEALLVSAYTDTMGTRSLNDELAHNRAQAVLGALRGAGGIALSRIFVNELPLTDLPVVTGPQIDAANNRSVWLASVPLPQRERAGSDSPR